jgi:uncharacterized protein YkwD
VRTLASFVIALLLAASADGATSSALESLNTIRAEGCDGKPGLSARFELDTQAEAVARELSRGVKLRDALARVGYRARHSTSLVVSNASSEASMRRVLLKKFCADILDATLTKAGIVQQGEKAWIVLAAPFVTPSSSDTATTNARVLELVNEARSHRRWCGMRLYQLADPLKLVPSLNQAALRHAKDMATHSFMEHTGRDGSTPAQRVTGAGYVWRSVGENVASGSTTPEQAVEDWLKSPGHCSNLMSKSFTDMGVAFAVNPASTAGIYWSQVFAAPKQ